MLASESALAFKRETERESSLPIKGVSSVNLARGEALQDLIALATFLLLFHSLLYPYIPCHVHHFLVVDVGCRSNFILKLEILTKFLQVVQPWNGIHLLEVKLVSKCKCWRQATCHKILR